MSDSSTNQHAITIAIMAMGGEGGGVLADWLVDLAEQNGFPSWVEVDAKNFKGVFKALPDRAEFANDVNEQLVVELYSK